mgnify:CR=1 FL=1
MKLANRYRHAVVLLVCDALVPLLASLSTPFRAAPKKNKKTSSSDEWLAPRAKRADFKPATKSRRKSSSSGRASRAPTQPKGDSADWKLRSAGAESRSVHAAHGFHETAMSQHQFGEGSYVPHARFPPSYHMVRQPGFGSNFRPPYMAHPAAAAPRYPVYSHMENAAAWQPTAHSGFGGDMRFAYRGYSDMYEQSSAAIAGDALAHMAAERLGSPHAGGSMQHSSWPHDPNLYAYAQDSRGRTGGYMPSESRSQHSGAARYAPGVVPAPAVAHNEVHATAAAAMSSQWGSRSMSSVPALPSSAYSSNPMLL